MNTIVEYKEHYVIRLKGGQTIEISLDAYPVIESGLMDSKSFVKIGDNIYSKFEIIRVEKAKPVTDVEAYIFAQPKQMREKINKHAKDNNIIWNSIDHVNNFLEAHKKSQ